MIYTLSNVEYAALQKRVADGKAYFADKWNAHDWETKIWKQTWFELADQLFEQMCLRGEFQDVPTQEAMLLSAEQTVERVREKLILRGVLRKPRKKGVRKIDHTRSESHPLFATS